MSTKISITRALATLTKVEGKIQSRIDKLVPTTIALGLEAQKVIPGSLVSVADFENSARADFQAVNDLILVRDKLKAAIIHSNATTTVKVGSEQMTVAEAIERKRSIQFEELLLSRLRLAYNQAQTALKKTTTDFEGKLEASRTSYFGRDKAPTKEQLEVVEKPVRDSNTPSIVDPIDLADQIRKLEEKIEDFKSNVDYALSESNAKTEVDFEGSL